MLLHAAATRNESRVLTSGVSNCDAAPATVLALHEVGHLRTMAERGDDAEGEWRELGTKSKARFEPPEIPAARSCDVNTPIGLSGFFSTPALVIVQCPCLPCVTTPTVHQIMLINCGGIYGRVATRPCRCAVGKPTPKAGIGPLRVSAVTFATPIYERHQPCGEPVCILQVGDKAFHALLGAPEGLRGAYGRPDARWSAHNRLTIRRKGL